MSHKIYLDNAATTPLDKEVLDLMTEVMANDYGNPSSVHALGRISRIHVENARKTIAQILNVSIGEVFFTSSATESNNTAIKCAVRDLQVERIISSKAEHHCVIHTLDSLKSQTEIVYLNLDSQGNIDHDELSSLLSSSSKKTLVSLMHTNNEIGTMHDIKRIGEICHENGALFHCDAVQSMGKFELDLQDIKVHFISGTAHKINGPKGIGMLYINNDVSIKPYIDGGAQERNMRAGTENLYGIIGFGKAMQRWNDNRNERMTHIRDLRHTLKEKLIAADKGIHFFGNQDSFYAPHVLNVGIPRDTKSEMIMMNLDIAGICASAGSACSSGSSFDSHVLAAIDAPKDLKAIRFSFSYTTSIDDVESAAEKFIAIL